MATQKRILYYETGSGIIEEALHIQRCTSKSATHFVLCNGRRLKYIINLNGGKEKLVQNIAAYNAKLFLLLKLLPHLPYRLLQLGHMGYFAKVELASEISELVPANHEWNVLVGTYDTVQKIILQCYTGQDSPCTFIKVGNAGSKEQMEREIRFLLNRKPYHHFTTPEIVSSQLISEGARFNILATKEFSGNKIPPALTPDILAIYKELAGNIQLINGEPYEFSHGDFAPWNIRQTETEYTLFDWEHCGLRPAGYDPAYFILMTEITLNLLTLDQAFIIAHKKLQELLPDLKINEELIREEFTKTTKAFTF